jgi:hypothetical protein
MRTLHNDSFMRLSISRSVPKPDILRTIAGAIKQFYSVALIFQARDTVTIGKFISQPRLLWLKMLARVRRSHV